MRSVQRAVFTAAMLLAISIFPATTNTSDGISGATITSAPQPGAGYRVAVDPVTGRFLESTPILPPLSPSLQDSISTSSEGLIEEPSPVPNGGVMVRLNGRFKSMWVATTDENGLVAAECVSGDGSVVDDAGESGDQE